MKKALFTMLLAACSLGMQAQFSGQGSGTEKDPYQITNADQLFEVRNDLTAYYKVMNDIDLGVWIQEDNPNQGWMPIGTESSPFNGCFDGNNKVIKGLYINRPNMNYQGLFGFTGYATIKNVSLVAPNVTGADYTGLVVGLFGSETSECKLADNSVIGGVVTGKNYVGGVAGRVGRNYIERSGGNYYVVGNYSSTEVNGTSYVGGIVGCVGYICYYWDRHSYPRVRSNFSNSRVIANNYAGGITGSVLNVGPNGSTAESDIIGNIVAGYVQGESDIHGVVAQYNFTSQNSANDLSKNVACLDTLIGKSPKRISAREGADNYAYTGMVVMDGNKVTPIEDDNYHGTSVGMKSLMRKNTYIGLGFDFDKQWNIVEGETLPFNINQTIPARDVKFESGSRGKISGTAQGTGKAFIFVGNKVFETYVLDGKWETTLGNISEGTIAQVAVATNGLQPSIFVKAIAEESTPTPQGILGDANGDGVVDSADVTAIINYILGKPGASFNKENADVTGDGEILIDDAVQTVQIIMNAQ